MSAAVFGDASANRFARPDVTRLLEHLDDGHTDAVVLDLDGTLRGSGRWLQEGRALLELLRRRGTPFVILTNDASRFGHEKARELRAAGASVDDEHVITCADLTVQTMRCRGWTSACVVGRLGSSNPSSVSLTPALADFASRVMVLGSGTRLDDGLLSRWAAAPPQHCLVANADLVWLPEANTVSACPGLIARALHSLSESLGQAVEFIECGKPSVSAFSAAAQRLRELVGFTIANERIAVFGDSVHSDIEPARRCGMLAVEASFGLSQWKASNATRSPRDSA